MKPAFGQWINSAMDSCKRIHGKNLNENYRKEALLNKMQLQSTTIPMAIEES